jgi:large subunit ribosomal protein L25
MSTKFELAAEDRTDLGKGASRRLRRANKVPAILYGGHREPRCVTLDHAALIHDLENESFYSSVLTITIGDKSQPCVLKDLQRHPARNQVLHVDLQRVLEDEEIRVLVPLHFLNEQTAPGVKQEGGTVSRMITEVEVSCLPKHLPEYIDVDVGQLQLDEMIMLSELSLPEGVSIPDLAQGEEADRPVLSISHMKMAAVEEEEAEEAEAEEVPPGEVPVAGEEPEEKPEED